MKTVVGLYNSIAEANKVKTALTSKGFDSSDIEVIDQSNSSSAGTGYGTSAMGTSGTGTSGTGMGSGAGVGGKIKNFFESLTGHDEDSHRSYTEGVTGGGAMVAVTVDDAEANDVADLLQSYGARDIQGAGTSSYGTTGRGLGSNTGYTAGATTGEQVIPIVAEELAVGKREVERGGVRVYSRVVSEPVRESVTLHEERVVVDRRPVDRPATDADFNTGAGVIEVTATGEEAVVGKRSRVIEEVLVGKEGSNRTEEISDTIRHTEVEVEQATTGVGAGSTTGTGMGTGTTGMGTGTDVKTGYNR